MKNSPNINHARVLLVEDHKNLALAVGAYLESSGFTMDYAYDGLCGLHLATTQRYEAIILDIMLPALTAWKYAAAYVRIYICRHLYSCSLRTNSRTN